MIDFIAAWHARVHGALVDGLAPLAALDRLPVPDGVLGDFVDVLCALQFEPGDLAAIACLIEKTDPHLQEAGVQLARAAWRTVDVAELEPPLARLVARPIDPWVAEALADLLADPRLALPTVYANLVKIHGKSPAGPGIMRNRGIRPWARLEGVYEQHMLHVRSPAPRDLAYLPILERRMGTRGWAATQRAILTRMGFDPDAHLALLR